MRKVTMFVAAAAVASAALPGSTALAEGSQAPSTTGGGEAPSAPNWGTVIANSMCASPVQASFPGMQGNGECNKYY